MTEDGRLGRMEADIAYINNSLKATNENMKILVHNLKEEKETERLKRFRKVIKNG